MTRFRTLDPRRLQGVGEAVTWHPTVRPVLATLPVGRQRFWGVPFRIPREWLTVLDRPVTIDLRRTARLAPSHLLIVHACDVSTPMGDTDRWPGQITEVGQHLADYVIFGQDGTSERHPIRRRYEIGEILVAWGELAFGARPHRENAGIPSDVAVWPPDFGFHQTGVIHGAYATDGVPPATTWWVHALPYGTDRSPLRSLTIEPTGDAALALAGVTWFEGTSHPLRHSAATIVRVPLPEVRDPADVRVDLELGVVARRVRLRPPRADAPTTTAGPIAKVTWPPRDELDQPTRQLALEIAASPDAILRVDGRRHSVASLERISERHPWTELLILDDVTGRPLAARVNVRTDAGVTLAPAGHPSEVNIHWFQDQSPDVRVAGLDLAYLDGSCRVEAPVGPITVVAARGFEYEPYHARTEVVPGRPIEVRLRRAFDRGPGWMTADTHVHFLSPTNALLQAEAEDVDLVNLLATQWGRLFTNVGDLGVPGILSRGRRSVVMGSENRQHLLGHLLLLGTGERPVLPFAAAGVDESTIGDPVWNAVGAWAERGRERGGLAIAPHFPEPYAEVVADALLGLVDAVELNGLGPHGDSMDLYAWYALLGVGLRIGCVAGTDKMWAGRALGAMRTYARIDRGEGGFDAFRAAVRAGRTIATNGPLLELRVAGQEPGATVRLPSGGGRLDVDVAIRSVVPVDRVELVRDGAVVTQGGPTGLSTSIEVTSSGWLASRASGLRPAISGGWHGTVAAHTSPVYVEVDGSRGFDPRAAAHLDAVMAGGQLWLDTLATRPPDGDLGSVRRVFEAARKELAESATRSRRD